MKNLSRLLVLAAAVEMIALSAAARADAETCENEEIFPIVQQHVHGSTIVELPNGDLLTAWFQGSGERWADDVAIMGARRKAGATAWSKPFVMADTPGFPDINPVLFLDSRNRLWLLWYTVIANQWDTSLLKYRLSEDYASQAQAPRWTWQEVLHVKPGDLAERGIQPGDRFVKSIERQIEEYAEYLQEAYASQPLQATAAVGLWKVHSSQLLSKARGEDMVRKGILRSSSGESASADLGYPYFRRMGWQTKNKAVLIDGKRLIVPLYSDGFSFSLMAITDDDGATWQFSEPLVGAGNIQPSIARRGDGALVAYMRDNGPPPQRLHVSTSTDAGLTWSTVHDSDLPNPGSGADIVMLGNGHWVLAYNDTEKGRHSLAVSLSTDDGKTWSHTRHLEHAETAEGAPSAAYPSIIQTSDGSLHVVYSQHGNAGKTIKHARFTEQWLMAR
ncbi:MAG TPA: exo-alpha-sialidase [Sedimentisphaerales bacterium]|nr:exo-alpha-sialidase [Sedimentisphaerales bacterium]HNU28506.1 exo-alpha-sialidase [Sedimentisphaerales bacterium]